jgi:hypothetical protein
MRDSIHVGSEEWGERLSGKPGLEGDRLALLWWNIKAEN